MMPEIARTTWRQDGLEIARIDPEGRGYGSHSPIHSPGDDDATRAGMSPVGPSRPAEQRKE